MVPRRGDSWLQVKRSSIPALLCPVSFPRRSSIGSRSKLVSPINLVARGDKKNGLQRVDLTWNGPDGAMFDVYRNGVRIASVQAYAYTDTITKRGPGSYAYRVCAPATAGCSDEARVSF